MATIVIKRDGREKEFSELRVLNALTQAYASIYNGDTEEHQKEIDEIKDIVCENVLRYGRNKISVEKINDFMLGELKGRNKDVYASAVKYRKERDKARKSSELSVYREISSAIKSDLMNENANMSAATPSGQVGKYASETMKAFTKMELLSDDVLEAVEDNTLHIHDMDYYPTKSLTCLQHDLKDILKNGFKTGDHGSMRGAKRIETASFMACMSMQNVQNLMHGGQAIPAFDFYMAPYVRMTFKEELKHIDEMEGNQSGINGFSYENNFGDLELKDYTFIDLSQDNPEIPEYSPTNVQGHKEVDKKIQHAINRTVKRTHQAMEAFVHNMNGIHSRGGNQVVFSSINYGTDTSAEGRCVIRELLHSTYEGVGNGETAIFPIQIWKMKAGVSYLPEDPNYDLYELACKVSAKRFFPNFINDDSTFNSCDKWDANDPERYKYEAVTMGCRTRVQSNRFGEFTALKRGNLSFSTINIVKLALLAKKEFKNDEDKRIEKFFELLDKYVEVGVKQLLERFEFQCSAKASQFPQLMLEGMWMDSNKLSENDKVGREVLKHGTLSIGYIGLAECLTALTGKHHGESEESQKLGLKIVEHMRDLMDEASDKYDLNFSLLATPAEGLSGKFTKKDIEEFGVIEGITDKKHYTNSNHIPVAYKINIQDKIRLEAPYHKYCNAGHILYVELDGDVSKNWEVVKTVNDTMYKNNAGYWSINHVTSKCVDCGYESFDGQMEKCPKCGSDKITVIERITGYLVRDFE